MLVTARGDDRALLAATFVVMTMTTALFPLLAPLQHAHHLPTAGLGIIAAGPYLTGFVVQLGTGRLADRGHGRALMTVGLVLASVSSFGMAIGTALWHFVVARALAGVALGAFLPTSRAAMATLDPARVAHQLGRLSRAELCGVMVGPVAAAVLENAFGLDAAFVLLGLGGLVLALLAGPALPGGSADPDAGAAGSVFRLLRSDAVLAAVLLVVAIELPVGMFDSMWSRYLTDRGASELFIGLSVVPFCLPFVLLTGVGGRIADRVGAARAAAVATLLVAPIIATYAIPHRPAWIVAVAVIEACFQAVAVPAARAAMAVACPPDRVAAGQGLAGAFGLTATGLAALVCPPVYAAGGAYAMCGLVAVLLVVVVAASIAVGGRGAVATAA
jgi:MFS family permease